MVDAKARQDCIKEIELLQSLDHPNIIRYLSSFVENNEVHVIYACYKNTFVLSYLMCCSFTLC